VLPADTPACPVQQASFVESTNGFEHITLSTILGGQNNRILSKPTEQGEAQLPLALEIFG